MSENFINFMSLGNSRTVIGFESVVIAEPLWVRDKWKQPFLSVMKCNWMMAPIFNNPRTLTINIWECNNHYWLQDGTLPKYGWSPMASTNGGHCICPEMTITVIITAYNLLRARYYSKILVFNSLSLHNNLQGRCYRNLRFINVESKAQRSWKVYLNFP